MIKHQRRVFLKVIATGPLVGCMGADPENGPGGFGGAQGTAGASVGGGPAAGSGGKPAAAGGAPSTSGGSPGVSGSPFTVGGSAGAPGSAGAGVAGMGGSATSSNPGTVVGNVSAYPLGSFSIAGGIFFIGHDAGGLYAMSMQCTHKFCAVDIVGNELDCPCHHSRFDRSGNVLVGPATTPLPHYTVYVDSAGTVSVDRFSIVAMSARTKV